ncbi:DUF2634 domain-containing protein [Paenibacillus lautus]|uniref:DUF2634 domain-containing protein n=1 Tax=Paenibacillus lautus TaxID=1401 RepID=UPI003D2756BF
MIPTGGQISQDITEEQETSRTWKLDFEKGRVIGMVDELEAVKQAVFKIVKTERFQYLVYSFDYGMEMQNMLGKSPLYVQTELRRRIQEALIQDDRIQSIEGLTMDINGDELTARFTVVTNYGSFESEVNTIV